jgi:hypothetical protein
MHWGLSVLLGTVLFAPADRDFPVEKLVAVKLRSIELPADLLGPGWRRLAGVRIDSFDDLTGLSEAEREQAKLLQPQLVPEGVRAAADYSLARTNVPLDTVTVRVFLFTDAESCRKWWNKKYRHEGWENVYRTVDSKYGSAVDSLQINKRAIAFGNAWITTQQNLPGDLHLKAADYVIEQLRK